MTRWLVGAAVALSIACGAFAQEPTPEQKQTEEILSSVKWQNGPASGEMDGLATLKVPEGYVFAKGDDVGKLMQLMQNPISGAEVGFLAPDDLSWFMVFEFSRVGYVKDDDAKDLNADALLKSIKDGTSAANEERRKRGWTALNIVGWEQVPRYDASTNNLVWAIRGESSGSQVVNYNTRILGREGVMEVALVCEPTELAAIMPSARALLNGYSFVPGKRYAEFRQGDKVAEYGLAALITGGAVAVAAKTGLLAKILKVLGKFGILIVAALAAAAKKLFGKKPEATFGP